MKIIFIVLLVCLFSACQKTNQISPLPIAISNNAVALIKKQSNVELYSFNGLMSGKTHKDITNRGFRYKDGKWLELTMPDSLLPVLASTAVNIGSKIYLIGGYTVDAKGAEKSVPEIFVLDTDSLKWSIATTMPIPVDDTVALVYANRYIYLVSGWHDVDNVSAVQVFDSKESKWLSATPYPAPAVFGQAGGIVDNIIIVCDGVKVVATENSRKFVSSPVCVKGIIDESQPKIIDWQTLPHHSGTAFYRMAAVGDANNQKVVFVGGSDNPYNYDGIGYDGVASKASNQIFTFNIKTNQWHQYQSSLEENMDHRALLIDGGDYYIIGGMDSNQKVLNKAIKFKLPNE